MIVHCKELKSYWVEGGEIQRRLVTVGKQPVVLMSKSHPILRPCFTSERWKAFSRGCDLSAEFGHELKRWNRKLRFAYNCHALAIGELLGMDTEEWIEGSRSVFTLMANPAQDLLDAHFEKLATVNQVSDLPTMSTDDVLVFRDAEFGDLMHSGRIRHIDGEVQLLSKLGEHPAAITSIEAIAEEYQGQFDCLDLYRLIARDN